MGIKNLNKLLSEEAPECMKMTPLKALNGRKIAIDASMAIYQFLIAVRQGGEGNVHQQLTNEAGETTSHIQGMFSRTVRFLLEGIKPVYVFDGKPPTLKSGELLKRREKRAKAEAELKQAKEEGDLEKENQQNKRLVRAGTKENDDCKKLLRLMGCPVVEAPCEAEAQCAALCKEGKVYASATEDMDCLTFATPVLLRKMTFAKEAKAEIQVLEYAKAVKALNLTHDEFVDLCIMLGCDYCDSIGGVGPVTALKLIKEHKNIENVLKWIKREGKKFKVPDSWLPQEEKEKKEESEEEKEEEVDEKLKEVEEKEEEEVEKVEEKKEEVDAENKSEDANTTTTTSSSPAAAKAKTTGKVEINMSEPVYIGARRLFKEHEVLQDQTLNWKDCDGPGLTTFLVDECGFAPDRVASGIEKIKKAYKSNSKPQMRMDSFFTVKKAPNADQIAKKRQAEKDSKKKGGKKAKKSGGFSGRR